MRTSKRERRGIPLFWQLMGFVTLTWMVLLLAAMGLTLRYALHTFQTQVDDILESTVATLADTLSVRQALQTGVCDEELRLYLDSVVEHTDDLDYITIANTDSIRVYHIDPDYIGLPFEGDDQYRALAGEAYFSDASPNSFGEQHRAFQPVFDTDGTILGFVMASAAEHRMTLLRDHIWSTYLQLFLLLMLLTLLCCSALAIYLGRLLRGVKPEDMLRVYLTQNDILNSLDEGLISYDTEGRVRLVNRSAARMLGHREELLMGCQLDELLLTESGESLTRLDGHGIPTNRANILAQSIRLPDGNLWARRVLILVDRTEFMRQNEELGGTRHIVTALRANTHEFLNKMQVISGLLQMGLVAEAQRYIGDLSQTHDRIIGPVMQLIRNPNVAALILGKQVNMREQAIELTLLKNSALPEHSRYLSTGELVTVIGNLLENAIEALSAIPREAVRSIVLQITEDSNGLLIMVSDTGEGIDPKDLPYIYKYGFSTKAASGRGVGMSLIREIVDHRGGTIEVDTEPGYGTTFGLIFGRERGGSI